MSTTPDLGIPYIAAQQGQPEITHNEAISLLQALANGVIDRGVDTPPAGSPGPAEGDAYIVGDSPTGAWAGRENCIAVYFGTDWLFLPGNDDEGDPIAMGARQEGLRVWVRDEDLLYVWTDTGSPPTYAWTAFAGGGGGVDTSIIAPDSATAHTATNNENGGLLIFDSAFDCTLTLPQQSTEVLEAGWHLLVKNVGGGNVLIATEGSDVLDGVSLLQTPGQATTIVLDEVAGSPPVNTYSLIGNEWLPTAVEDDALTAPPVTSPPSDPPVGAVYIPAATATGAWAGQEDDFAIHVGGGAWEFVAPPAGWVVYEKTSAAWIGFVPGTGWVAV